MARQLVKFHISLESVVGGDKTLALWGKWEDPDVLDEEGNPTTGDVAESRTDFVAMAADRTGSEIVTLGKARLETLMGL